MNKLRRFWWWLTHPEYPSAVHEQAACVVRDVPRGEPTEIVEPAWREGYVVGLAQGELHGRLALSLEIERMFPEHKSPMDPEDAARIRSRQVH